MRATALGLAASVTALVVGAWLIPFRFPPREEVLGASFEVGFNNSLALLWSLLLAAVSAVLLARLVGPAYEARGVPAWLPAKSMRARRVVALVIVLHLLVFAAVFLYRGRFVFAEALYFQSLLHRMSMGEVPYVDFSYYYGPSMLYPAHWLSAVLGLELAYGVWLTLTYLAGLVLLFAVLRTLLGSEDRAAPWFVALAVAFFNPWMGLNLTFVRFVLPTVILLATVSYLVGGGARRFLIAVTLLALGLTYSFDVAALGGAAVPLVALALSALRRTFVLRRLYALLRMPGPPPGGAEPAPRITLALRCGALLGVAVFCAAGAFVAIDPTGTALRVYPETALAYGGGAYNQPIYPHLPFLGLAALTVAAIAGALLLSARLDRQGAALIAAYALLALATQRGAFAVADPSHFVYYGLPIVLLAVVHTGNLQRGDGARAFVLTCIAALALPLQIYQVSQFLPSRLVASTSSRSPVSAELGGGGAAVVDAMSKLVREGGSERPYLMYALDYYSLPLYRQFQLRYPTYESHLAATAITPAAVRRAVEEIRAARALVLVRRADFEGAAEPPVASDAPSRTLALLTGAQLPGSELRRTNAISVARIHRPLFEFLRSEYATVDERDGILLLSPRTTGNSGSP